MVHKGTGDRVTDIDFDALFASHHRKVVRLAGSIVGPEHAEDVAQLAWLNAWRYRAGFEGNAAASSWLYRITSNTALSWLRSTKRRRLEDAIDAALEIPDPKPSPESAMLRAQRQALMREAMDALPPKIRTAVFQVYVLGHRTTDVIAASGAPPGTTKNRLHRGRQALLAAFDSKRTA